MEPRLPALSAPRPSRGLGGALLAALLVAACNSGGGGGRDQVGRTGQRIPNPAGGTFFVDQNQGGNASRLGIAEMFWGRLVDIHDVDANGEVDPVPVFRNFVINENQPTNVGQAELDINPITQSARLIVKRTDGEPEPFVGAGTFEDVVRAVSQGMPPISPKHDDGSSPEPFSFLARNSTLVIRFDDLLDDSALAQANLAQNIEVLTGYAPEVPFAARMLFDPNHGGLVNGKFHSTRVLIDMTVSETEAASTGQSLPVNAIGLPGSLSTTGQPNVSIHIPTVIDGSQGQFTILRSLGGSPLATTGNGPVDFTTPTIDVVRAMRAGNSEDVNNGFLLDLNAPEIVGGWPVTVGGAFDDPAGAPGFNFILDATFSTVCRNRPDVGDILSIGSTFVEVTEPAGPPDSSGMVRNVKVRVLTDSAIPTPTTLLGSGLFLSTYDPGAPGLPVECWVSFAPQPAVFPATSLQPSSQILLRFTEPMDPASVLPFDTFLVVQGQTAGNTSTASATTTVVGQIQPSPDLKDFVFAPVLPLAHTAGVADGYHVELKGGIDGVTDLAGNALFNDLPFINFTIDPAATTEDTAGIVLRFNSVNEFGVSEPPGVLLNDLRGQFFYDLTRGVVKPRPVLRSSYPADRNNPVPGLMVPFPPGVQTPLSPLGSKLHTVWRYADFAWLVEDETKYNLDIEGLNWSPVGGQVVADFYEEFEMRLSHSFRLPDEYVDPSSLLPSYPGSGLVSSPNPYTDNLLLDPLGPQVVVHNRALGYQINPVDLFVTGQTPFMPFPLNRGAGTYQSYTWRDTSVLGLGGPGGAGVPMAIEVNPPLSLYGNPIPMGSGPGHVYRPDEVPTVGLPLLLEVRCYPSDSGVGLNSFDISLAVNSSARPNFRSFSTGGVNTAGATVIKNPDLEAVPSGGFNPTSTPPGRPTAQKADNSFYLAQIDTVVRVSRIHTIFLDTQNGNPDFLTPIIEPNPSVQPAGTAVDVDFRGADSFSGGLTGLEQFDGDFIDPYGSPPTRGMARVTVNYHNNVATWTNDINGVDGAKYLQMRFTFFNNVSSGQNAELSAVGVPYRKR